MQLLAEQPQPVLLPLSLLLLRAAGWCWLCMMLAVFADCGCVPDTWSQILSGWPSVTDSDVKRNVCGTFPWPAAAADTAEPCRCRCCLVSALLPACNALRWLLLRLLPMLLLNRLLPSDNMGDTLDSKRQKGSIHRTQIQHRSTSMGRCLMGCIKLPRHCNLFLIIGVLALQSYSFAVDD